MDCVMFGVKELAKYLGMSKEKIYQMVEAGELPHLRVGYALRFVVKDIEEWVRGRVVKVKN